MREGVLKGEMGEMEGVCVCVGGGGGVLKGEMGEMEGVCVCVCVGGGGD